MALWEMRGKVNGVSSHLLVGMSAGPLCMGWGREGGSAQSCERDWGPQTENSGKESGRVTLLVSSPYLPLASAGP